MIALDADRERQHTSVFFEGSRPGSTEDIVLTPAIGIEEVFQRVQLSPIRSRGESGI
ncbi:hypothetical protein [Streptomyces sp. NPDC058847]|uniref:hypothetical protein n=1 Tax=Streptomyces sp. NPDC058847 TaxID=3346649 RepID=UPI003678B4B3